MSPLHRLSPLSSQPRRGGAVIILSLSLLMTLLFLGLFFYSFIDDELSSSEIYARQFQGSPVTLGNAGILNHGLEQVIVGTNDSDRDQDHYARYSVLAGGRFSLLAHIVGAVGEHDWNHNGSLDANEDLNGNSSFDPWSPTDFELYNGSGIRVWYDSMTSQFVCDTTGDGTQDLPLGSLVLNGSELAGGSPTGFQPDTGYTYPDLNSLFLYHELKDPGTGTVAVKPSFDAPGILYATGSYTGGNVISKERVLRPHSQHQVQGNPRYLTSAVTAQSGDTSRTIPPLDAQYRVDVPNQMGIWNGNGSNYDLHVDADGDGTLDSWLIDLDHPLIDLADGRQAVPLFFWKIEDADALINLNSAGDMPLYRLAERASSPPSRSSLLSSLLSDPRSLTAGNYGLSVSEINPGVGLYADPTDNRFVDTANQALVLDQFQSYFNEQAGVGSASMTRGSLANTELLWLMTGRHQYDSNQNKLPTSYDVTGRYGEASRIARTANAFAAPGTTGFDDDRDSNQGRRPGGGAAYYERFPTRAGVPTTSPVPSPPAVHPLDATGYGVAHALHAGVGYKRILRAAQDANNPSQWLYYSLLDPTAMVTSGFSLDDFPVWQFPVSAAVGVSPWLAAVTTGYLQAYLPSFPIDALSDEPDEVVLDDTNAAFANPDDEPFAASEMAALHASNADWSGLARTSRLRTLAPVNFELNYQAAQIRKLFTVQSWDRPEFGFTQDNARTWEFNDVWTDPNDPNLTAQRFPPQFGSVTPSRHEQGVSYISANDPLRPEVRRLLTVEFGARYSGQPSVHPNTLPAHPLVLNGILSDDSLFGGGGDVCFDQNGNPRFRPLVPHPLMVAGTDSPVTLQPMIHSNTAPRPYAFSTIGNSKAAQEWWARYDRQRLARDMYMLLWTTSAQPGLNTATSNPYTGTNGYVDLNSNGIADAVEEMAQFAVNVVDAMDHDNVITRFEYDPNPTDGWSWTSGGPVVYGVEAQALTFSEVLWIRSHVVDSMSMPKDHLATPYDDSNGDTHFLFVELRNALPFNVPLGNDTYRIRRTEAMTDYTITFKGNLSSAASIGPGENYLVGMHSGFSVVGGPNDGKTQAAIFWLDDEHDQANQTNLSYIPFAPYLASNVNIAGNDSTAARQVYPNPVCDLDLCHDRDRNAQRFKEFSSPVDYFLATIASAMSPPNNFELILERRQNMQADGLITSGSSNDGSNDWVEIDRVTVRRRDLDLKDSDPATTVQTKVPGNLISQERREPFYAHGSPNPVHSNPSVGGDAVADFGSNGGTLNGYLKHSLGAPELVADAGAAKAADLTPPPAASSSPVKKHQRNSVLPQGQRFEIWQPHFDRGFTSVYDLLSVLTIGPSQLILSDHSTSPRGGLVEIDQQSPARMTGLRTAEVRFANPQASLASGPFAAATGHYANRWYRLFGFLTLPSHTSDEIADDMTFRRRIPGRVNLNTLRHEHVLGAVLNDRDQLTLGDVDNPTNDTILAARNWYDELRRTRDGVAAGVLGGGILPPGTPYANPFRPMSYDDPVNPSAPLAATLLRRGSVSGPSPITNMDKIGVFEARTPDDAMNATAGNRDKIDWHTKQRILSRIANLTTNRSHVYVIWGGFQLHEAHDLDTTGNNPQIQIGGRFSTTEFPTYRELIVVDMSRLEEAYDSSTGSFDFSAFIVHREVLP